MRYETFFCDCETTEQSISPHAVCPADASFSFRATAERCLNGCVADTGPTEVGLPLCAFLHALGHHFAKMLTREEISKRLLE